MKTTLTLDAETALHAPSDAPAGADDQTDRPIFRRRRWVIDPAFQGRYILHLSFFAILGGLILGFAVAYSVLMQFPEYAAEAQGLHDRILGLCAFGLFVVLISSVFLSHRVAGPGYRLAQSAERVAEGDTGFRIRLRRHDHLKPSAEAFNRMLDALEARQRREEERRESVRGDVLATLEILEGADESELPEALRRLEEVAARLRD